MANALSTPTENCCAATATIVPATSARQIRTALRGMVEFALQTPAAKMGFAPTRFLVVRENALSKEIYTMPVLWNRERRRLRDLGRDPDEQKLLLGSDMAC